MAQTGQIFNIQKFSINDGPGIRTTVFFKGCPLACRWCANPESQNRYTAQAQLLDDDRCRCREVTVEEVMAEVLQDKAFYDQSGGGMTLSGGEVLQQAEFAAALCRAARAQGIHTAAETTGFAAPEQYGLSQSDTRTDIYSLGVLMNVMLTGQHPSKKLAEGRLGRIIQRCTQINPAKRYKNVLHLMEAL